MEPRVLYRCERCGAECPSVWAAIECEDTDE